MKFNLKNILFLLILLLPFTLNAESYGTVNDTDGINIRSGAGTNYNIVVAVGYNTNVTLNNTNKISGTGCANGWYLVSYGGYTGYACSTYLTIYDAGSSLNYNGTFSAKVYSDYVSVKNIASSSGTLLDVLIGGTSINIISSWPKGNGCTGEWYYITYNGGKTGYSCSDYIKKYNDLVLEKSEWTEDEKLYANSLLLKGFKDSYLPYLLKLHRNHPNWIFEPYITGQHWNDVVSGEEGQNKIESSTTTSAYLPYYVSSLVGTEGGTWYYTNNGMNAYYLDPRNFLSDSLMFMFEDLSYNNTYHTDDILKKFLGENWIGAETYRTYIMNAAKNNTVSPLHLAARMFKEGAGNPNYGPVTGTSTEMYNGCSLTGYYNFYNIGSYSNWTQGLYYAAGYDSNCNAGVYTSYGRPWNTIEKAINGGALFLAEDYINAGQNTLYFQKFNTKVAPLYVHQYMTNIAAPVQESETIYNVIKSYGLLDNTYTFIIPIYENMPTSVSLPTMASTNNNLTAIKINNTLIDNFDKDVIEYTYYVTSDTTSVNISTTKEDDKSIVSGDGIISINDNTQEIKIGVTAENGILKTYKITIIKVDNTAKSIENIISSLSTKTNGNNMGGISPKTDSSSLINTIKSIEPTSSVVYKNANGNIITSSTLLKTGDTLNINSNNESVTYTIIVNGDSSGDGIVTILDLLKTKKHILNSVKLTDAYLLAGDTNNDNKVDILDLLRVKKYILGSINL